MDDWKAAGLCAPESQKGQWDVPFHRGRYASEHHPQVKAAIEACGHCPVLDQCREFATGFRWNGVVIGAWVPDPRRPSGEFPPWGYPQAEGGEEAEVLSA